MLREENENLSHLRKRETILSKKDNMEYKRSDTTVATKKEGVPNIALKKLNRTQHIKSEANKPKTLPTESRTGQSNEAFQNIPRDKTQGGCIFCTMKYMI